MLNKPTFDPGPHWRLRFWSIFGGQSLSLIGSALTQFVLVWWITDTTGSMSALAVAGLAAMLPQALLSPLGGILADRYSRRLLMISADAISALCMVVLIILFATEQVALWHIYTMMAIRSAMQAFQAPAAMASVATLVPASYLIRAGGLSQALQSLTIVFAAPLGALAISAMPIGLALSIDVATAVLGIVPLLCFRIPHALETDRKAQNVWRDFQDGVALVWKTPGLRQLYALLAVVVLAVMPAFTLVPLLVKEHFSAGATQVALMEGSSGIGMVLGGLLVAAMAPRRPMLWILLGFSVSCLAMALTALAPSRLFSVAVAWWVISGVAFVLADAPLIAMLRAIVPNQLQGRVFSLLNSIMGLAAPVGLALLTPLGEVVGVRALFVIAGLLGAGVSLAGFLSPSLMRLHRPPTVARGA
jgi:MFS transporter, DHA3 family, macrolide efflux protein